MHNAITTPPYRRNNTPGEWSWARQRASYQDRMAFAQFLRRGASLYRHALPSSVALRPVSVVCRHLCCSCVRILAFPGFPFPLNRVSSVCLCFSSRASGDVVCVCLEYWVQAAVSWRRRLRESLSSRRTPEMRPSSSYMHSTSRYSVHCI